MNKIRAWHFVAKDENGVPVLGYDMKGAEVVPGRTYSIADDETPKLCGCGMHASRKAIHALGYATGTVACLVDVWGDVLEDDDKIVGRHRKVIAMVDAEKVLHRFGCWCVRQTWGELTDERSRRAVEVKEAWIEGRATDEEFDAARAAARAAAWDAAWAGALDGACGAWAANHAARGAALGAALDAARAAALDAARDAARATQNAQLERMLLEAMGRSSMND